MPQHPILIISGTNRANSNAMKIAQTLQSHYRLFNIPADILSLAELPSDIFTPDVYAAKPPSFLPIQQRVLDAPGLHIVTPEYNGSFPGILKYFIDMLKFPESFQSKPVAFVGESSGSWGALRAVEQLQMVFGYRNAHIYPDRVFIPTVHTKFDPQGNLLDLDLTTRLKKQAQGFASYASHLLSHRPPS